MKTCRTIIRSVFVSPELLVIVAGFACLHWWPAPFIAIAVQIGTAGEVLRFVGLLAAGLVAYDVAVAKSILLPEDDKRNVLQHWSGFSDLKVCVVVGLLYAIGFAVLGVVASFLDWTKPTAGHAVALLIAVAGSLVTAGSFLLAQLSAGILLRKHTTGGE